MVTLAQIIDDIRGIVSSGSNPNEFKIPDEQIAFWVNQCRATLIGQSLAKKDDLNDTWLQYINCLMLEQADASECCLYDSDCIVLRTVKKIPSTIDTWKSNWIVSVTTPDGSIISKSNQFSNRYQKYNKYTGSTMYFYVKNDYIYIINSLTLDFINVIGLFQDPLELSGYNNCEGDLCFTFDSQYPCSLNMASQITDIVVKTKALPLIQQFKPDDKNDGRNVNDDKQ